MAAAAILSLARRSSCTARYSSCICSHLLSRNRSGDHLLYFSTSTKSPPPSFSQDFFIEKYKFSPQIASKLASASARMKNPQNPHLLLSFLRETGCFSHSHLERIVRHHPKLLSACVETSVKPKFKIIQDLGLSAGEAAEVVSRDFNILTRGANRLIHSISVLKCLLGSNGHVIKLIKKHPSLFYADPEKTILPNIEYLKSCGIQIEQINSMLYSKSRLFAITPENMRRCVCKADEMGVQRTSRMFIHVLEALRAMPAETLELKLKSFLDLGFSQDDIFRMFRTAPQAIAVSTPKMHEVKEVLLETGKYDMSCIVKNPLSLLLSVEKRYKPRLEVLKALEERSIINQWPSLSTLCCMTDESFFEKFVAPNMKEVGKDFIAKTAFIEKVNTANGLKAQLR